MLESGDYFQCPTKAKEHSGRSIPADPETPALDDSPAALLDKRTKEYKDWKASQEEADV